MSFYNYDGPPALIYDCVGPEEEVHSLELSMRLWYKHGIDMTPGQISRIGRNQLTHVLGWEDRGPKKYSKRFFWRVPKERRKDGTNID